MTPHTSHGAEIMMMYGAGVFTAIAAQQQAILTPYLGIAFLLTIGAAMIGPTFPPTT